MTCKPGGNKRAVSVSALLFYEMSSLPYHRRIGLVGLPCFLQGLVDLIDVLLRYAKQGNLSCGVDRPIPYVVIAYLFA